MKTSSLCMDMPPNLGYVQKLNKSLTSSSTFWILLKILKILRYIINDIEKNLTSLGKNYVNVMKNITQNVSYTIACFSFFIDTSSIGTCNGLKSRLSMKDDSECITHLRSQPTSNWKHCFVGIEKNSGCVYY